HRFAGAEGDDPVAASGERPGHEPGAARDVEHERAGGRVDPAHEPSTPTRILPEGQHATHPLVLGRDPGEECLGVSCSRGHQAPRSQPGTSASESSTTSGDPFARSASRNLPVLTSTPVMPAARAPSMSFVMSSPTMAARAAATPRSANAVRKYVLAGLPQITALVP